MKLSERLRNDAQLNRRHKPGMATIEAYSQGLDDCAVQVEELEARLEAIVMEASHEIAMAPVPIEVSIFHKGQRPTEGNRVRLYEKVLFDALRKVGEVARGKG